MNKLSGITLALAIISAPSYAAFAQNAYVSAAGNDAYTQSEAAPIERPQQQGQGMQGQGQPAHDVMATHPAQGITVRADSATEVKTVASDAQHTELRLERGIANVLVRDPAPGMLTLIDLPGGQVQLLKNGFYTFNAESNTARVFSGEADAFVSSTDKPMHVKGGDQVAFVAGRSRISYSDPYNARADVLMAPMSQGGQGYGQQGYGNQQAYGNQGYGGYGYAAPAYEGYDGGYGDGFYGGDYPYYAYGYGYPYGYYGGYGYPGFGLGFGFYGGGYYGGGYGYRGGYGGGYGGRFPGGGGYPGGGPRPGVGSGGGFHGGSVGGGGAHGGGASGGGGHR